MYRPPAVLGLVVALLYASALPAEEPVAHLIDLALFEIVEDGVAPSDRDHLALNIWAGIGNGQAWADCRWVLIGANKAQKYHQLFLFSASTEQRSIRNLVIDRDAFSFEIVPTPAFPDRAIRVVATRKAGTSNYKIGAVGIWTGLLDKSKLVKIEWRQVPSITLPFNTITR